MLQEETLSLALVGQMILINQTKDNTRIKLIITNHHTKKMLMMVTTVKFLQKMSASLEHQLAQLIANKNLREALAITMITIHHKSNTQALQMTSHL